MRSPLRCLILDISRQLGRGPAADLERAGGIASSIRLASAVGLCGGGDWWEENFSSTLLWQLLARPDRIQIKTRDWMWTDKRRGQDAFQLYHTWWVLNCFEMKNLWSNNNCCISKSFQKFVRFASRDPHIMYVPVICRQSQIIKAPVVLYNDAVWPLYATMHLCLSSKLHMWFVCLHLFCISVLQFLASLLRARYRSRL